MKNLIILLIAITSISLNAQENQNDATKGEAVTFLKKNIQYINYSNDKRLIKFSIEDLYLYKRFENDNPGYVSINYNDIKEVKMLKKQAIIIYAYGNVVNEKFRGVNRLNNIMRISILSSNKNLAERLTKALKQIAYWNKIEKSKSKF